MQRHRSQKKRSDRMKVIFMGTPDFAVQDRKSVV